MGEDRNREAALRDRARRPEPDGAGWPVGELEVSGRQWMRSFAIITTTPNELRARLHNRMPAVLKPEV
jgi:putative SOS response-associated peptidase YedK